MSAIDKSEYGKYISLQNYSGSITAPGTMFVSGAVGSERIKANSPLSASTMEMTQLTADDVTVNDSLTVAGASDLNGALDVAGQTALAASGVSTTVRGTFNVDEAATFDSSMSGSSTLGVGGVATFQTHLLPAADNTSDLGSSTKEFKDLYLDGTAYVDSLQADQLGAALDANSQAITNINVDSGAIDGTVIGANSTANGSFSTLVGATVSSSAALSGHSLDIEADADIDGDMAVAGSVTAGTSFIIGSADLNEADMEKLDGITNGTVAASKAVVVDASKDASGFRNVTATGAVTAGTSFVIGSADLNEADMEKLDGITNGTVAASKAVVVDSNKDASGFRHVTAAGAVTAGTSFIIGSADLNEADLEKLDGITDGTGAANKALVLDGSRNFDTVNSMTSTFLTASYAQIDRLDVNEINSISRTETTLEVVDKLIVAASGSASAAADGGGLQMGGTNGSDTVASIKYDHSNTALDFNLAGTTEMRLQDGVLRPETDNDVDLGASGAEFKDLYLDGVAYIDSLQADQLGAALDANSQAITNINVDSGAIDGTVIGAASQAAAQFTTLSASSTLQVKGEATFAADILPFADGYSDLGSSTKEFQDLYLDGTAYIDSLQADQLGAALDANSQAITNINVDSGAIDGTVLGANSAAAGTFTTLIGSTVSSSAALSGHSLDIEADADIDGDMDVAGSVTAGTSFIIGSADLNETDMEKLDGITNGTVAASKAVVVDSNKDASGFRNVTATGAVTAGTSFIIGSADLNETDMEKLDGITDGTGAANKALVLDGSRDVDNINALGIASMANNWTNASRTVADMGIVTTMDLNGGSIDGTVIGAASATTATFSSAKVSDLTSGRVVLAGTAGEIEDSGNLTFNGSVLAIAGRLSASAELAGFNLDLEQDADIEGAVDVKGNVTGQSQLLLTAAKGTTHIEMASSTDKCTMGVSAQSSMILSGASGHVMVKPGNETSGKRFAVSNQAGNSFRFYVDFSNGDTYVQGDLQVAGNDIKDSGGAAALTFDGSQNTTVQGNAQVDGTLTVSEDGTGKDVIFYSTAANERLFFDASANKMAILQSGANLLSLGSNSSSDFALDVAEGSNNINKVRASAFVTYSDENLKTNVETFDNALDKVMNLRGVTYDWKSSGTADFGFIAQEIQEVLPECVAEGDIMGVDYARVSAVLVEAIKEQQAQIEDLKAKLSE